MPTYISLVNLSEQGSVRTQTMRAFPREEFEQIARGL